jgi:hypothetical protein
VADETALDLATADLVDAYATNDTDRIQAAEQLVAQLDARGRAARQTATLHQSALWYASIGLKVFPLSPGSKIPFKGSNGCLDASSNPDVINGWWDTSPDANIGIATGHLVDVVDIDGLPGQTSRAKHWEQVFAQVENDQIAKVMTPRPGGMHLYVPATGDGNKAGILPGVDYRGKGGYVVAPPSVIAQGHGTPGRYSFLGTPQLADIARAGAA